MYRVIDQKKTGEKMKKMLLEKGYDAKALQEHLNLCGAQSIYRWFHGKTLPSIDNLLAISDLLEVGIEDLLEYKD